jgi:hypothetical protein
MRTDLNEQIRELIDGGTRPVSFAEIMARQPVTRPRPAKVPVKHHPRRAAAVAASAAAAGIAAAITVALLGGAAGRERPRPASTVLTAAMVRQVAVASGIALAHSGHVRITYSGVSSLDPSGRSAGTDDITFSGEDWNDVSDQTAPPNGRTINRVVGGQAYYYLTGKDGLRWYRETNPREHPGQVTFPDPRKLLRVLDPAARFVRVGYQVIGGVRVEQLRATRTGHLPGLGGLPGGAGPGSGMDPKVLAANGMRVIGGVTRSLDVWVDSHGVIRQMHLTSQEHLRTSGREKFPEIGPNGKVKGWKLGPRVPVRHGVVQASAWVSFLDIGKPQTITAPAHAIPSYGRG